MATNIDLSYLQEISGGDASFIKEMLELYVNTTAQEAILYKNLLQNKDYEGIGILAHKMKAAIQMLGANELFNLVRTVETNSKNNIDLNNLPEQISRIEYLITDSIDEIQAILKTL
ncbi:MAG: Hpt domain-containing protein [Bacteroidetes bacterium]|jgi:HPt (histidine-containing phosphotransfer) domain-containing protein|nr:Hpt domain-containing protein [Bacteroidota bacterium]